MTNSEKIYQSILNQLSLVPVDYLQEIDIYLQKLTNEIRKKEKNREMILKLAGAWNDMSEKDFNDYLIHTKKVGGELFNGNITSF